MDELLALAKEIRSNNAYKGFGEGIDFTQPRNRAVAAALIMCETAEMIEELRFPEPQFDAHLGIECEIVEWADQFIRLLDYAEHAGFTARALQAVQAKIARNKTRAHRHGKTF